MHVSDAHFDEHYVENTNSECGGASCCRVISNATSSKKYSPAGYWGSVGNCDPPRHTYDKIFETISRE